MLIRLTVLTTFLLALLSGFAEDIEPKPLIPLAVGNIWVYEQLRFDSLGNISDRDTLDLEISGSTDEFDVEAFFWSWELAGGPTEVIGIYDDGYYVLGEVVGNNVMTYSNRALWLQFPAAKGDTFINIHDRTINIVHEVDVEKEIPSGTYRCYEIRTYSRFWDADFIMWFSPGIGLVASESKTGRFVQRLIEFDI